MKYINEMKADLQTAIDNSDSLQDDLWITLDDESGEVLSLDICDEPPFSNDSGIIQISTAHLTQWIKADIPLAAMVVNTEWEPIK